ncbi:hypothetical protein POPTR_005G173800v4 [Populus trichocarpa]|uniref:Uncharacterized protein n=1 Tax=Populus trichocarpa TaxID=3694 RepID=A0ACC0T0F8_POPTR|nr:hypothetical protein POPTR_005G173800v4 [Populus trichocarpa]
MNIRSKPLLVSFAFFTVSYIKPFVLTSLSRWSGNQSSTKCRYAMLSLYF